MERLYVFSTLNPEVAIMNFLVKVFNQHYFVSHDPDAVRLEEYFKHFTGKTKKGI